MHIRIVSICQKTPSWVEEGYRDYLKRFPPSMRVESIALPPEKRIARYSRDDVVQKESAKLLAAHNAKHHLIALDSRGEQWSTEQLVTQFRIWGERSSHVDLIIGGADGLSPECLNKANQTWSLSRLTFPHTIMKLLLIEQLYRVWSIVNDHPYHR